jgi:hypothetical protein
VNDSRYWRYSHGTCWSEVADDLLVVDVPGDHFSLLRQVRCEDGRLCRLHLFCAVMASLPSLW